MIEVSVTLLALLSVAYTVAIFSLSRRHRSNPGPAPDDLFFVFVVPCLNEEVVIARTIDSLLEMPGRDFAVLVVDDGSEDRTPEILSTYDPGRVWRFRRILPNARQGKGRALNHAFKYLRDSGVLGDRDPKNVIVAILDADGRLAPNALREVAPYFADPKTGAVQIGVRMYNASDGVIARMQDLEFVTFTEIFQRGRQHVGSVGLGGNGQFTRLSALEDLGDEPWTDCLTEDLDLGLRLLLKGWKNNFCSTTHVSQQAVTNMRRLVRQRSRWFQGHLQCWKRAPDVLRSRLPDRIVFDLLYLLATPGLVLGISIPFAAFLIGLVAATAAPAEVFPAAAAPGPAVLVGWWMLSFGLAPVYGFVYWKRDGSTSFVKALGLAHLYSLYSYMWFLAGWMAVGRIARGQSGWAKTARTPEAGSTHAGRTDNPRRRWPSAGQLKLQFDSADSFQIGTIDRGSSSRRANEARPSRIRAARLHILGAARCIRWDAGTDPLGDGRRFGRAGSLPVRF